MTDLGLFHGEDMISAGTGDLDRHALAMAFRASGHWEEIVPGMNDLTVKYDPLHLNAAEAEERFLEIWKSKIDHGDRTIERAVLKAIFDDALDLPDVASALGIAPDTFPEWLSTRSYRVTMMGFQPGFAYLEDLDGKDLPLLPRLDRPRQRVTAGSVGFLGQRACIYALDGPGGWPIVGRVEAQLFTPQGEQPFLLEPGQIVRFTCL